MKPQPIRVLQCLRSMNRAGLETWLMHLLRHFDRSEIAIDFLVQTDAPGAFDEEIHSLGARIFPCRDPRQPWLYARDFLRILRDHGPYDVVHSQNYLFAGLDLRLAAFAGVGKRIAHIHPVRDLKAKGPFRSIYRRLMTRWIRQYATLILAPSQSSLDAFGNTETPRQVVHNCVDLAAYSGPFDRESARRKLGLPLDRPVIAYIARFEPHKDHLLLVDIANRLTVRGLQVHFAVGGSDGAARRTFAERIAGRSDFSLFVDVPDVAPLLRCSDLFLFPSREEGFGIVAIEAAAAGLPVVATDLPGIREALYPTHRRFMFPEGDDECAARNVETILEDPPLAACLSDDALLWARQFTVGAVAEHMRDIYGASLHRKAPGKAA